MLTLRAQLHVWIAVILFVLAAFAAFHAYSGRRRGKSWPEIARTLLQESRFDLHGVLVNSVDPHRAKRIKSFSLGLLIGGIALIGLFVAWVRWKYPFP